MLNQSFFFIWKLFDDLPRLWVQASSVRPMRGVANGDDFNVAIHGFFVKPHLKMTEMHDARWDVVQVLAPLLLPRQREGGARCTISRISRARPRVCS